MKTTNRILFLISMVIASFVVNGCTENYSEPPPIPPVTDQDIIDDGYEIITIAELKQKFYDVHGTGFANGQSVTIEDDVAIKGRVISNDYFGNIYRSIYIQDYSDQVKNTPADMQAIEIKVGLTALFTDYRHGDIVYVKAKGLVLGNYRFMLSLGAVSADPDYANGYIDLRPTIRRHLLVGEANRNLPALDTLVVNSANISSLRDPEDLGRLVRFEGINSIFGTVENDPNYNATDIFPSFLRQQGSGDFAIYTTLTFEEAINAWKAFDNGTGEEPSFPRPGRMYPTYAFSAGGNNYYGSTLLELGGRYFIARTSGYSSFSNEALPFEYDITRDADGYITDVAVTGPKQVDRFTAIYTKYAASSGRYIKFQLLINNSTDVEYDRTRNPSTTEWR